MPRARLLKPGFFTNELLAELPFEGRLLFAGLWTLADREGRLEDRPKRIKAAVFPYNTDVECEPLLAQLAARAFILRYEVGGTRYIQIGQFLEHQAPHYRETPSEIPPPDGQVNSPLGEGGVTKAQRKRIFDRDVNACLKCGSVERLTIDHIVPGSIGGNSDDSNLQTLCQSCNSRKQNHSAADYRRIEHRTDVQPTLSDIGAACAPVAVTGNRYSVTGNGSLSTEPLALSAPSVALMRFSVVGKGGPTWALEAHQVAEWERLYPNLDVRAEMSKALAWTEANPGRRKTVKGMPAFLVNWMSRATDRRGSSDRRTEPRGPERRESAPWNCTHEPRCGNREWCAHLDRKAKAS